MASAMTNSGTLTIVRRDARPDIAVRHAHGVGPAILFLPGYASDMSGSKACALFDWATEQGRHIILFDYAGCGESGGNFADETLESWRDDALGVIAACTDPDEPVVLVGSSMGGWLMLMVARALGGRVVGMVGIAAAPDFTQWGYTDTEKTELAQNGKLFQANPYGPEPTLTTYALWESGQRNLMLDGPIAIDCPVELLHGQADEDVPFAISLSLADRLRSSQVRVQLIKEGDHRLSREADIFLLVGALTRLLHTIEGTS